MAGACKVRYAIEDIFWHHYRNLFFVLMFSVSDTYKNEIAQKKDKPLDLSSLVAGAELSRLPSNLLFLLAARYSV